jgi:outer membrane autotransporter protein
MGGGLMGRYEIDSAWYGEASVRAGQVKTDFNSGDILSGIGTTTEYETSAMYAGMHVGAGYIYDLGNQFSVDANTKLFYTYQGGDDVVIAGDKVAFEAANSVRSRTGARFLYAATDFVTPYAGAYLDYEFGGDAKATINGTAIDVPTLNGATGVGELGLTVRPSEDLALKLDAGVQGYAGARQGFSGSLHVKYEF